MSASKEENVPFEEALKRLESVVEEMEDEALPLEALISRFEEGTRLARLCQKKLSEAETKIRKLEKDASNGFNLSPFEGEPEPE